MLRANEKDSFVCVCLRNYIYGCRLGIIVSWAWRFFFQVGLPIFQRGSTKNFGRIFLEVGPAGFISDFEGKSGVGPDN